MLLNYGAGEDSWAWTKAWTSWTVRQFKPVSPKGNQPWILIGRSDAEVEAPILWPPDMKSWLTGQGPGSGKDWRQAEKMAAENEMVEWHHWLNGHEFELTLGDSEGQGSLACCIPWGVRELNAAYRQQQQQSLLKDSSFHPDFNLNPVNLNFFHILSI